MAASRAATRSLVCERDTVRTEIRTRARGKKRPVGGEDGEDKAREETSSDLGSVSRQHRARRSFWSSTEGATKKKRPLCGARPRTSKRNTDLFEIYVAVGKPARPLTIKNFFRLLGIIWGPRILDNISQ
ncbi:hypothetical protein GWI33_016346 [Rhynchophorus ferrugineus]|uniref:Uncharacterized protein n=1 Tax=Rhynchophorus ferrugineus TaxID=354439 RepID=A0A834I1G3_RHYFE|nr:hypothetical protein GWI33_016346 [Rhynchophorus ferrugineus]